MAAQTGKHFQELLCEGRAQPVESTDPVAAKTIDDLKKQVSRQRAEVEAEKTKFRELRREHEREIRAIREQAEKKLEKSLDALSHRKDGEKVSEVAQVKERLLKQNQQELRTQRGDLEEEMRRLERRLTREREESMRKVLDVERKRTEEELSHYLPEDSVVTREEHLKAEIFRLGEEVERLEFQVRPRVTTFTCVYIYILTTACGHFAWVCLYMHTCTHSSMWLHASIRMCYRFPLFMPRNVISIYVYWKL